MNKLFSDKVLIIIIGVALAVMIIGRKKSLPVAPVQTKVPSVYSSPQPSPSVTAKAPVVSQPAQMPVSSPVMRNSDLGDIDLCREFSSRKFLVPKDLLRPLMTMDKPALAVPDSLQKCLTPQGGVAIFKFAGFSYLNPIPYYFFLEPRVFISTIEKGQNLAKLLADSDKVRRLGFGTSEEASRFYSSIFGAEKINDTWSFIQFSVSDKNFDEAIFFSPPNHPYARSIKKEEVRSLQNSGALVVDVRQGPDFEKGSVERAQSIPVSIEKLENTALSYEQQVEAGFNIHPAVLPKSKDTKIVLINQNPKSFTAYNAVTYLASMGYKNLYYYWGGFDDWNGKPLALPTHVPAARYIGYKEFKTRLTDQEAMIIDVRPKKAAGKKTLPRAMNIPFTEKKNDFNDPLYRSESFSADAVKRNSEGFSETLPEIPQYIKTIVLVGGHSYDWKAVKAALIIPRRSTVNVEIYKNGYKGWKTFSSLDVAKAQAKNMAQSDSKKTSQNSASFTTTKVLKGAEGTKLTIVAAKNSNTSPKKKASAKNRDKVLNGKKQNVGAKGSAGAAPSQPKNIRTVSPSGKKYPKAIDTNK